MTHQELRTAVVDVLVGLSLANWYGPNEPAPESPSDTFVQWSIGAEDLMAETADGSRLLMGRVEVWILSPEAVGSEVVEDVMDQLAQLFNDATPGTELTFRPPEIGEDLIGDGYVQRPFSVPYIRQLFPAEI